MILLRAAPLLAVQHFHINVSYAFEQFVRKAVSIFLKNDPSIPIFFGHASRSFLTLNYINSLMYPFYLNHLFVW